MIKKPESSYDDHIHYEKMAKIRFQTGLALGFAIGVGISSLTSTIYYKFYLPKKQLEQKIETNELEKKVEEKR